LLIHWFFYYNKFFKKEEKKRKKNLTCLANSLVGAIIIAVGDLPLLKDGGFKNIFSRIGREKEIVFPLPVLAWPITSFPS